MAIDLDCDSYLKQRTDQLHASLSRVNQLATHNELPEASLVDGVLTITPLDNQEPEEAEVLTRQAYAMLPRISKS